ncbi:sialoadhesin-like [Anneissia japonica]|uniref:sialoadhesin-like n=1 Tax=Anneissia japonica TaxID=1529436 RepID=UPI0014257A3D|nr:sialoadhesin-like [Anneissia japonica]
MMIQPTYILTIIVLFTGSFAVEVSVCVKPNADITEYQTTQLICYFNRNLSTSFKQPMYRWSKYINDRNKHLIATYYDGYGAVPEAYRKNISIDANGNIVINRTTRADAGAYECEILIFDDEPSRASEIVNITVLYLYAPDINLPEHAVEGDLLDIFCSIATAYPAPILILYKGRQPIYSTTGTILKHTISNATRKDTGEYICRANNDVGSKESDTKSLNIHYIDCQLKSSFNSTVVEGKTLSIFCHVNANPNSNYTIYKNNNPIKSGIGDLMVYSIDNVKQEDAGNYHCMVTNFAGTVTCGKRSIFVTYVRILSFAWLDGVATCVAEGDSCPTVTISVNGTIVSTGHSLTSTGIEPEACKPMGTVMCNASNEKSIAEPQSLKKCTVHSGTTRRSPDILVHQLTAGSVGFFVGCTLLIFVFCIVRKLSSSKAVNNNGTEHQCQPHQSIYQSLIKNDGKEMVKELGGRELRTQVTKEGSYLDLIQSTSRHIRYNSNDNKDIELKDISETTLLHPLVGITQSLQGRSIDVVKAYYEVKDCMKDMQHLRENTISYNLPAIRKVGNKA